jgi:chorismate lyase/3-hydroxybenzoate synthase
MHEPLAVAAAGDMPVIAYESAARYPAGDDVLAAICFGAQAPDADPRWIRVGLEPLGAPPRVEVWRVGASVVQQRHGRLSSSVGGEFAFGRIAVDQRAAGGIEEAARVAYAELSAFVAASGHRHVLRMWNYFDRINDGEGDAERYRQFCAGRARGMPAGAGLCFPAATAIGRLDGDDDLLVYWLAARQPGTTLENPRQVSAFHYPRIYGPVPPLFSRAMLVAGRALLVSGTASVIGHETRHAGDVEAQLRETLANLASVREAAGPLGAHALGAERCTLKVYLREPRDAVQVEAILRRSLPAACDFILLHGDICRRDLLVEIDGNFTA